MTEIYSANLIQSFQTNIIVIIRWYSFFNIYSASVAFLLFTPCWSKLTFSLLKR